MPENTSPRIAGENALKTALAFIRSIRDDHHSSVLRETYTDASAVVDRNPRRAGRRVNQRIKQRPVCNRVTAVEHSFSFAIWRCNRARIEMIAPNHNRRFDFAALHQFVHGHTELGAIAVTEPADPRRQSLKLNSFTGELHPAGERLVLGK